jgi:hypothetical protein
MRKPVLAALAGAAALVATPAAAGAAALQPLKPCYVSVTPQEREPVQIAASGFSPGAPVQVLVDGAVAEKGNTFAGDDGSFAGTVPAPYQPRDQRPFTVTVVEPGTPNQASQSALVTALTLSLRPRSARPSERVRFRGRGFTATEPATGAPAPIYGHYVFGGRLRRTVELAVPRGACGAFSVRARQIPLRRPSVGTWLLQVDQQREYTTAPVANVHLRITVRRAPRARG